MVGSRASPNGATWCRPGRSSRATSSPTCRATSASTTYACRRCAPRRPSWPATGGVDGFCYYHYWFEGRRLLERPFDEVLASGRARLPFCLCWANERWTRAWDGRDSSVLVEQTYSAGDDHAHARWLARVFADERYLRVDGRPVFLVYRAAALPDARRTTDLLRSEAQRAGIGELLLCRVESFRNEHGEPTSLGFDAAVEHQPDWTDLGRARRRNLPWRARARRAGAPRSLGTASTTMARRRSTWRRGPSRRIGASRA